MGSLSLGSLKPGQKVNTEGLCVPRNQPEKEREGEGERERERIDMREATLMQKTHILFSKGAYIP